MMHPALFALSHTQFGMLQSAVSIPNLIIPLFGGIALDTRFSLSLMLILATSAIGHVGFSIAIIAGVFWIALLFRGVFGMAQGSTVVASSQIIAQSRRVLFVVALSEAVHNLCVVTAKVYILLFPGLSLFRMVCSDVNDCKEDDMTPAQRSTLVYEFQGALTFGVGCLLVSLVAGAVYVVRSQNARATPSLSRSQSSDTSVSTLVNAFPWQFWIVCALHLIFSNSHRMFEFVSPDLLLTHFGSSLAHASLLSSLSNAFAILLCPLIAYSSMSQKSSTSKIMWVCAFCGLCNIVAFALLMLPPNHEHPVFSVTPYLALLLLSIATAAVPSLLRTAVAHLVQPRLFGRAYGVYEISESLGAVVGHPVIGLLRDWTTSYASGLILLAAMSGVAAGVSAFLGTVMEWTEEDDPLEDDEIQPLIRL